MRSAKQANGVCCNPVFYILAALLPIIASCKKAGTATTAFYYWKTGFQLNTDQQVLLQQTGSKRLYIRFFDINWNDKMGTPYPDAVIQFHQPTVKLQITPVIYIRNKVFEKIADNDIDSLAIHCNRLINRLAAEQHIHFAALQVDCDWTVTTKEKYFDFLRLLKKAGSSRLEATIRLHQAKYKQLTGIPPVDRGILMFYNMGKLNALLKQPNSIYNHTDAEKYVGYLKTYPLLLDVALPLFSWSVQIRNGKALQVYEQVGKMQLQNEDNFVSVKNDHCYRAKRSFFIKGIYIKQNDIFKLEEVTGETLKKAVQQLADHLAEQQNRIVIFYELANIDASIFKAETLNSVSDSF